MGKTTIPLPSDYTMPNTFLIRLMMAFLIFIGVPSDCNAGDDTQGVLHGAITDINGNAVAGAEVYAYTSPDVKRPGDFISNTTQKDGLYRLTLPAGALWIVARQRQGESRFGPLNPMDRHSGDPQKIEIEGGKEKQMDLTVANIMEAARQQPKKQDGLIKVEGIITDSAGNPLPMAYVVASQRQKLAEFPEYLSGWTDSGGTYAIFLPKGTYFLGPLKKFPPPEGIMLNKKVDIDADTKNIILEWKE